MSKLTDKAQEAFKFNTSVNELFMTEDGKAFFNENAAANYCKEKGFKKDPEKVEREGAIENEPIDTDNEIKWGDSTVDEIKGFIAVIEDVEVLEAALDLVKQKTAKEAIAERIEELKNPEA